MHLRRFRGGRVSATEVEANYIKEHKHMNVWKPLAIASMSAFVVSVGYQTAAAKSADPAPSSVQGDYRRMHAALDSLRVARDHLLNSEHNHGGWRERAIESTDRAIHETEAAVSWAP
jgi:hypothetical protein